MKDIKVSIIIPVYNAEKTIEKCLDSLISQTYSNIEIICINDCSKDGVLSILERYEKEDSRIVLINHTENKNAGGARNTGIRAAQGEYICFVDQDDWMRQDAIEILVNASNDGEFDCVTADWIDYYSENKQIVRQNLTHTSDHNKNVEYALLNGFRILGCLFQRKIFFENDLFFPEKLFFEDNAIYASLLYCCSKVVSLNETLYFYYSTNPTSTTHTIALLPIKDRLKTANMLLENSKRINIYNQYKDMIDYRYLMLLKGTLNMLSSCIDEESESVVNEIVNRISTLLPNQYVSALPYNKYLRFRYPRLFYHFARIKRRLFSF